MSDKKDRSGDICISRILAEVADQSGRKKEDLCLILDIAKMLQAEEKAKESGILTPPSHKLH